ncbi:hypothetical protein JXB12_00135 [candidate division KSB1 bacterium]|nr:hypothetical protein [candidate division KSB1 bacterium]
MEKIQELYVILVDEPNALGHLCTFIAEKKVNIETIAVFGDSAKLIVKNTEKTKNLLEKNGYTVEIRDVLRVVLENKPGELAYVTSRIGHVGINIKYMYSEINPRNKKVYAILDVDDLATTLSLFKEA